MGIDKLNEKEIKNIKGMNTFLKYSKIHYALLFGTGIFLTILPIVMPFLLKKPEMLLRSIKLVFTTDYYYISIGVIVMMVAFLKVASKHMVIINKLMQSEKN